MARCDGPGEWQVGIWCVTRQSGGTWEARATGPGTIGDGSPHSYPTLAAAYLSLTGEPMPGAASPGMVPQPSQQQQAQAVMPHDRPLAARGLISYRYKGAYGWIMLGATDDADALKQAARSTFVVAADRLERWNGEAYAPLSAK